MLQLSAVELQEYIDEELEKNPLLTKEEESENEHPNEVAADEPTVDAVAPSEDHDISRETKEVDVSDKDYSANEDLVDGSYGDEWSEGEIGQISAGDAGTQRHHVGVVVPPRHLRLERVGAQRAAYTLHLVGGDGNADTRGADHDALVAFPGSPGNLARCSDTSRAISSMPTINEPIPFQPARCQNTPPSVPATLDPA